ncbi:recombinase family protein [Streptomyces venezuelae]|uniref:recombinase family protein n=1 Tax=Streptomyces venezuelae TaxID=54571 RepID=UPI00343882BB
MMLRSGVAYRPGAVTRQVAVPPLMPGAVLRPGAVRNAASGEAEAGERRWWLRRLREAQLRTRTATGRSSLPVLVYVLAKRSDDLGGCLAVARAHAQRQGWSVLDSYVDDLWRSEPHRRPILARALAAVRRGDASGLVCVSRTDISASDALYEQTLHLLHGAQGFLSLQHPETDL